MWLCIGVSHSLYVNDILISKNWSSRGLPEHQNLLIASLVLNRNDRLSVEAEYMENKNLSLEVKPAPAHVEIFIIQGHS